MLESEPRLVMGDNAQATKAPRVRLLISRKLVLLSFFSVFDILLENSSTIRSGELGI